MSLRAPIALDGCVNFYGQGDTAIVAPLGLFWGRP
jgi:hypothetical protein